MPAMKILREILSLTRSFMVNTCPLVGCPKIKLRSKSKTIPCLTRNASSRLVYCSSLLCPSYTRMYLVLQHDSRFVSWSCHVTHITLTERLCSNSSSVINLVYSYKVTQTRFECSVLILPTWAAGFSNSAFSLPADSAYINFISTTVNKTSRKQPETNRRICFIFRVSYYKSSFETNSLYLLSLPRIRIIALTCAEDLYCLKAVDSNFVRNGGNIRGGRRLLKIGRG